jgi:hypothetical protein
VSPLPIEPKFRATCECGWRAPRWTSAFTQEKWMNRHIKDGCKTRETQ